MPAATIPASNANPSRLEPITLFPSTTVTGTAAGSADSAAYGDPVNIESLKPVTAVQLELDVSAAAKEVGDTLDVAVQTSLDDTNWFDICAFTQVLGNGGAKRHIAKLDASLAQATFEVASALSAGAIRNIIGRRLRVKYVTTNDADDPVDTSFTFSVHAVLL